MIMTAPGGGRSIIIIIIGTRLEKFLGYVDLSIVQPKRQWRGAAREEMHTREASGDCRFGCGGCFNKELRALFITL